MKSKPTNNYLNYRNFLVLGAVVFLLLITLTSCSNASPSVYTVTFNANGGTVDGKESIQSEVAGGTAVKEPSDPIRTGYSFDGWCIEGQSETYDFSTPVNSDLTLVAKWTRLYYKVTFKADGGTFSGDDSLSVASGDTVSIPASPTKDRHRFDGWYVEGVSEAYNFSTPVNSDLTLVAKWTITECIVTFNLDEGSFSGDESVTVDAGKAISKPVAPTKTGYLFAGWFEEGSDTYYDFSTPVNRDLTLVAIWTAENTLSFTENASMGGYIVSQGTNAPSGLLAIPDEYNGKPVVAISSNAFYGNNGITAVTIPASVESIFSSAFYECNSLSTVTFESDSKLSEISICAFAYTAIESIEIPASVTSIGESAFESCTSLSSVTFEPGSILSAVSNYAFLDTALTRIEIPATVTTMGTGVFSECDNLQTIHLVTETVPDTWSFRWMDGCNATVYNSKGEVMDAFTFTKVEGGYSVSQSKITPSGDFVIPDTYDGQPVVAISSEAFSDNPNITAVTIPASVKSIGSEAFYYCTSLTTITFAQGSNLSEIGDRAFDSVAIENIEIPATVTTMGSEVFSYCTDLQTIKIGTENIPGTWDTNWDANCNAKVINSNGEVMSTLTFTPVEGGGYSVSQGKITPSGDIVIPDTYEGQPVVAISSMAFYNNNTITAVTIPASVKSIGSYAFRSCSSLTTVTFAPGSNLSEMGDSVFDNSAITSIEIPASLTVIPADTFRSCTSLSKVTFAPGSNLSTIGDFAFYASVIDSIEIPATVTTMGFGVFYDCTKLQQIKIGTETVPVTWDTDWNANCDATVIYSNNETI